MDSRCALDGRAERDSKALNGMTTETIISSRTRAVIPLSKTNEVVVTTVVIKGLTSLLPEPFFQSAHRISKLVATPNKTRALIDKGVLLSSSDAPC